MGLQMVTVSLPWIPIIYSTRAYTVPTQQEGTIPTALSSSHCIINFPGVRKPKRISVKHRHIQSNSASKVKTLNLRTFQSGWIVAVQLAANGTAPQACS